MLNHLVCGTLTGQDPAWRPGGHLFGLLVDGPTFWENLFARLACTAIVRRSVDTVFHSRARRRVAELDSESMTRCQERILRGLVHQAAATRFGREHDFRRIRSPRDFRRLVRLRTLADFCQDYWQPTCSASPNNTWPGEVESFASAGASSDGTLQVPITPASVASHVSAAATALSFIACDRSRAHLLLGQLLYLGPQGDAPDPLAMSVLAHAPRAIRHYIASRSGNTVLKAVYDQVPVTCVIGEAKQLSRLFRSLLQATGRDGISDLFPRLAAIMYNGTPRDKERAELRDLVGNEQVLLLQSWHRPEAPLAVEDPNWGHLRLLADSGVFFEFVPQQELSSTEPVRHGLDEVVPGVQYEVAISSPAGVWACLTGERVEFKRRQPPLLERVETSDNSARPVRARLPRPTALPAPDPVERTSRRPVKLGLSRVR